MINLSDLFKQQNTFGGIRRAELIFERDILAFPSYNPVNLAYTGTIVLTTGARPYFIYFSNKESQTSENTVINSDAGDKMSQNIRLKTPKYRPGLRLMIDRLRNNRVALAVQDFNGTWILYRNLRAVAQSTSDRKGGYSGTTFTFSGESIRPSGFWDYANNPYITADPPTVTLPDDTITNPPPPPPLEDCCVQTYVHTQSSAASIWTINHNLGADIQRPVIKLNGIDLETASYIQQINYKTENQLIIKFKTAVPGKALITEFKEP